MQEIPNKLLPGGLWPVMLTPFSDDSTIDYDGLKTLTEYYISVGANGLFTNCFSSEMYQLSEEERYMLTKAVVDFSNGRVPVISTGSFNSNPSICADFVKKMYDQGVDAVILVSSILVEENEDDDTLKKKLEIILRSTGNIPLGMYECPVPYKRLISTEMMKWLADTGKFICHKDTSCKANIIKEKIEAVKGSSLKVYDAHTPDALTSMQSGAHGLTPISANFWPELYTLFLQLFHTGDLEQLKRLNDKMVAMDFTVHQQYYPWAAKAFLRKRGLKIQTHTRVPQNVAKKSDLFSLEALYKEFEKVFNEFNVDGIHV